MSSVEESVRNVLSEVLVGLDPDTLEYFLNILVDDSKLNDESSIKESLVPFIESYGFADDESGAIKKCDIILKKLSDSGISNNTNSNSDEPKILDKVMNLSTVGKSNFSENERAALDTMWGFDQIRSKRNETIDSISTLESLNSAKLERRLAKDKKLLDEELARMTINEDGNNEENIQVSNMMLPDFSSGNNEKDIQVNNVSITFGGKLLLENADLKFVYGRRYGLIGKNGIGKTTLLKHMAMFDIEGFPRHHRILHVKQEVKSSSKSVLEVVLEADVERSQLIQRQKVLNEQQLIEDNPIKLQLISQEITQIYERMQLIGADTAESRASIILNGLRFTDKMQHASTNALSGGWLMRVALASALLIEPDILMLDEPTNHLDLEAVLWLQSYLHQYPHTIILVSHDRTFLNEVCSDIILFKDLKLTYYRGNFDNYEKTRHELELLQRRQREAQLAKIAHMQEFVDKFRYNANRASSVQSRIKAINKEKLDIPEEIIEESSFNFTFPDAGQIGSNVIKLQQVSFGYPVSILDDNKKLEGNNNSNVDDNTNKKVTTEIKMLFEDVDLCLEQTSRIALVGPNGAGKSTLLNLIQNKIEPTSGFIHVNPQLRLAIFTQHHLESFDLNLSPLQNILKKWPLAPEPEIRAHLGRYEITGDDALKPMKYSSGGQKSRVAFACLTYTKPHIILLDEPTNHLDMNAIQALIDALKSFTGGVLVISHDQYFITSVCNEIWVVGDGRVKQFRGSFDDYKRIAVEHSKANTTYKKK